MPQHGTVPSSTFTTDTIANEGSTTDVPVNFELCMRTGFRQLPLHDRHSKMMIDGYGLGVRAASADGRHPLDDLQQAKSITKQIGPQNAEATDIFYTSIAPEDL